MKRHHLVQLAGLALALAAAPALADSWQFQQAGYSGGGTLTGSFAGVDADHDGWLSSFAGEVSAFQASFTGDSLVGNFVLGLPDIAGPTNGLAYRLPGGGPLGDDVAPPGEGLLADNGAIALLAGMAVSGTPGATVVDILTGADSSTLLPITVTAVPEPASALLLAGGLVWLLLRRPQA